MYRRRHGLAAAIGVAIAIAVGGAGLLSGIGGGGGAPPATPTLQLLTTIPAASQCTGSAITGVTFGRASVGVCEKGDQTISDLTSGQPALEGDGLLSWPQYKTESQHNEDFTNAFWTKDHVTITANQTTAPDGTNHGNLMEDDGNNANHRIYQSFANEGVTTVHSMYFKAGAYHFAALSIAEGSEVVINLNTCAVASSYNGTPFVERAANGWCRASIGGDSALGASFAIISMGDTQAHASGGGAYVGTSSGSIYVWRDEMEPNRPDQYPSPALYDLNSHVTSLATTGTVSPGLVDADTAWSIRARWNSGHRTWLREHLQGLFLLGSTRAAANTSDAEVTDAGFVKWRVYSADAGVKTWTATEPLSDGQHDLRFSNSAGTIAVYDGPRVLAGASAGSTGTGVISTMPATAYVGSVGTTGQFMGNWMDLCAVNSASGCATTAAASLTLSDAGGGAIATPFVVHEPEWQVSATWADQAELAGAGTLGQPNSFTLAADGGYVVATVWDQYGAFRTQTSKSPYDAGTIRLTNVRGELFLSRNDVPLQSTLTTSAADAGTGVLETWPTTMRAPYTTCASRYFTGCGGTKPNLLAAIGDSLTYGPPGSNGNPSANWPTVLDSSIGSTWATYNYSVGSTTIPMMLDEQWHTAVRQAHVWNYVVIMGGINDAIANLTGAESWAAMQTIISEAEANGATVILITPTPWKGTPVLGAWTSGRQTEFDALLTSIRGSGKLVVDAYAHMEDPGAPDYLDASFQIDLMDGIHLNQTAHNWIAGQVQAAMGL